MWKIHSWLVWLNLFFASLSARSSTDASIRTEIVKGGEVSVMQVSVIQNGQTITVSGYGLGESPDRMIGCPEIEFEDSRGKTLLRKDAVYEIRHIYPEFSRAAFAEVSRAVTFSVTVSLSAPVALVVVRNHSSEPAEDAAYRVARRNSQDSGKARTGKDFSGQITSHRKRCLWDGSTAKEDFLSVFGCRKERRSQILRSRPKKATWTAMNRLELDRTLVSLMVSLSVSRRLI